MTTPSPSYVYRAHATRILDGDTFTARIDLGFAADRGAAGVELPLRIRLHGCNAPELHDAGGPEARAYLGFLLGYTYDLDGPKLDPLSVPTPLVLATYKDDRSAERWVADVWLPNGRSVALAMVANGSAVEAFGTPSPDWGAVYGLPARDWGPDYPDTGLGQ